MLQLSDTTDLEAGATIQRMADNATGKVAEVERDEAGRITAIHLADVQGADVETVFDFDLRAWVVL